MSPKQVDKPAPRRKEEAEAPPCPKKLATAERDQLKKDADETAEKIDKAVGGEMSDELIDEIDGVLEENAEQFVKDYVQRGGE